MHTKTPIQTNIGERRGHVDVPTASIDEFECECAMFVFAEAPTGNALEPATFVTPRTVGPDDDIGHARPIDQVLEPFRDFVHGLTMPSSRTNIHPRDHECGQRRRRHKLGGTVPPVTQRCRQQLRENRIIHQEQR